MAFALTGTHNGSLRDQLTLFAKALQQAAASPLTFKRPESWVEAFAALEQFLASKNPETKWVVFFDEFPWLDSRRSGFLSAFENFWNAWASKQPQLVVVVCGSAASWMIRNVVRSKGGLHNRLTRKIRLFPFTLAESESFLKSQRVALDRYQILQLYMAFGGIPHYLKQAKPGKSAAQIIDAVCFAENGLLRTEFEDLYRSLFEMAENHLKVVRALSRKSKGLTRQELIETCKLASGGTVTKMLEELEESGFIQSAIPFQNKGKEALYRLIDEFSLFHERFLTGKAVQSWMSVQATQSYVIWCGMAFEAVCLKHIRPLKRALGIDGIITNESPWRFQGNSAREGAQIDLLIDRSDRCINLCEMKFYTDEFTVDKKYAMELEQKMRVFRSQTKTKKTIFVTLVSTYGVKANMYSNIVQANLTMDALFS